MPENEQKTAEKKESRTEEMKKDLLAKSEISLILDTYDDIFSDFDPRPYSSRGLSEDFLVEAKKASPGVNSTGHELRLMIPKAQRNVDNEALIKKRLKEYFRKRGAGMEEKRETAKRQGALMALAGFAILMLATYIISLDQKGLLFSFLIVVLEPCGWFTAWSGLETLVYKSKEKDLEIEFCRSMARAEITFIEY